MHIESQSVQMDIESQSVQMDIESQLGQVPVKKSPKWRLNLRELETVLNYIFIVIATASFTHGITLVYVTSLFYKNYPVYEIVANTITFSLLVLAVIFALLIRFFRNKRRILENSISLNVDPQFQRQRSHSV